MIPIGWCCANTNRWPAGTSSSVRSVDLRLSGRTFWHGAGSPQWITQVAARSFPLTWTPRRGRSQPLVRKSYRSGRWSVAAQSPVLARVIFTAGCVRGSATGCRGRVGPGRAGQGREILREDREIRLLLILTGSPRPAIVSTIRWRSSRPTWTAGHGPRSWAAARSPRGGWAGSRSRSSWPPKAGRTSTPSTPAARSPRTPWVSWVTYQRNR